MKNSLLKFYEKYILFFGLAGHLLFVLQAYEMITTRSADNVSLFGLLVALVSLFSWMMYGVLKSDRILVIVNIFGIIVCGVCCLIVLYLRWAPAA